MVGLLKRCTMLDIQNVTIRYGSRLALDNVCLTLKEGEIGALIGPNGAGKTSLIRAASGELKPESGKIYAAGYDVTQLPPERRAACLAVVPQARNLPGGFTVWETVLFGRTPYLGWLGRPRLEDKQRVRWALERTQTLELSDRLMEELSGGEQQRVLLARALAQETPILLLDEPTAHLDLRHQSGLLGLVRSLAREQGLAVLMALHDLNLVPLYADRAALLVGGVMQALGSPAEVLTPSLLTQAYQTPLEVTLHPVYGTPLILPDGHNSQELSTRA